jgi:hypothetical protein
MHKADCLLSLIAELQYTYHFQYPCQRDCDYPTWRNDLQIAANAVPKSRASLC